MLPVHTYCINARRVYVCACVCVSRGEAWERLNKLALSGKDGVCGHLNRTFGFC